MPSTRSILLVTVLLTVLPMAARADPRADLAEAARAFDDAALRRDDDNTKATPVRKRTEPVRLTFKNPKAAPGLVEPVRQALKQIAVEAALDVVDVGASDPTANFIVLFDENESVQGKHNCFTTTSWKSWMITSSTLKINPAYGSTIDGCIIHEAMHAFGFNSHPHSGDSVLSYVYRRRALTALDRNLIHTLYDPRVVPGLKPAAASQLGCRILGERMAVAAAVIDVICNGRAGPTP